MVENSRGLTPSEEQLLAFIRDGRVDAATAAGGAGAQALTPRAQRALLALMAGGAVAMTVGFVGAGRLGATLASALLETGYRVTAVASQHLAAAQAMAIALGPDVEFTTDAGRVAAACDLVFLTVPDAAIAPTCRSIAWEPRHRVVHCGGALGLDALAGVTAAGGIAGCLHPLQSFPSRSPEPERLRGIFCGVEGADPLGPLLEQMVTRFGAQPFRLEGVDRTLYHAAAVFVSNHVVALASAAGRLWTLAGLPDRLGRQALSPLLLAASANVAALELRDALTGPVARGDVGTVEAHLQALAADPALRELYRALSVELLRLPLLHEPGSASRLRGLLEDGDGNGRAAP